MYYDNISVSNFTDKLDNLISQNHLRRADVVRGTGICEGTIRGWYKTERLPSFDFIIQLAKFFNVTPDYFTVESESDLEHTVDLISPIVVYSAAEKDFQKIYLTLDDTDKKLIHDVFKYLKEKNIKKKTYELNEEEGLLNVASPDAEN